MIDIGRTSEKTLERKLCEKIKQMGGMAVKIWAVSFTGLPDRLVLLPGAQASFAEIKSTGQKPTERQKAVHEILRGLGFKVAVIDSDDSLKQFLEELGV